VSAWQVAQPGAYQRDAASTSGLAIISVLVGVLKLAGAPLLLRLRLEVFGGVVGWR
jgi:hypothetical protein